MKIIISFLLIFIFPISAIATPSGSIDIKVIVDGVPPETTNDYNGQWYNYDFAIFLTATDVGMGISETYYRINEGPLLNLTQDGYPIITTERGDNTLEYWSVDKVGNEELPHNLLTDIKLDKTKPIVEITEPKDGSAVSESPISVSGQVKDANPAPCKVEIKVDGNVWPAEVRGDGTFIAKGVKLKEGRNFLIATATDAATNTATNEITLFLGYVLHLPIPYYQKDKDYYSGAASCKMVLDYIREEDEDTGFSQDEIYDYGHPHNLEENKELLGLDPDGIDAVLGHYDPYDTEDPYGEGDPFKAYNFSVEVFDPERDGEALVKYIRDICHWMDYEVPIEYMGEELVSVPNVPAVIPIYGSYNNWVVVNGISSSSDPLDMSNPWFTPDFSVYGFWFTDPASDGIGADIYVTADESSNTYFLPLNTEDKYNGKYVQVAEPPQILSQAKVKIGQRGITNSNLKIIEIAMVVEYKIEDELKEKGLDWKEIVDPALLRDAHFKEAFQDSVARKFIKVKRVDKKESFYYLIPFDKYIEGQFLTSLVIIVDAADGSFKEATWVKNPARYVPITKEKAIKLAIEGIEVYDSKQIHTELIWKPCEKSRSPFFPFWKVEVSGATRFVTQDGHVWE